MKAEELVLETYTNPIESETVTMAIVCVAVPRDVGRTAHARRISFRCHGKWKCGKVQLNAVL